MRNEGIAMRELFLDDGESGRKRERNFDGIYKEWESSRR